MLYKIEGPYRERVGQETYERNEKKTSLVAQLVITGLMG